MPAQIGRLGRVLLYLVRPVAQANRAIQLVLLGLALLFGISTTLRGQFWTWIAADWTHGVLIVLSALLAGAIASLWKLEALPSVRIRMACTDVALYYHLEFADGLEVGEVLFVRLLGKLRNDGDKETRASFPSVAILLRSGLGRWEGHELNPLLMIGQERPEGVRAVGSFWEADRIWYPVPPRDQSKLSLGFFVTHPEGARAFLNKRLKLRLTLDVIGQPESTYDVALPPVSAFQN